MWKSYLRRWFVRWWEATLRLSKDLLALLLIILVLFLQFKLGWIKQGTGWEATIINVGPSLGILFLFVVYNAVAAVIQVDQDRAGEISALNTALGSTYEEWVNRLRILSILHSALAEGIRLVEICKQKAPNTEALVMNWDNNVPKLLVQYLGEEHRRIYYEGPKGEPSHFPQNVNDLEQWIRDRNAKLRIFIKECQEMPGALLSWQATHPSLGTPGVDNATSNSDEYN
jgi:hypothetical protein